MKHDTYKDDSDQEQRIQEAEDELDAIYAWRDNAEKYHTKLADKVLDKLWELDEQLDSDESTKARTCWDSLPRKELIDTISECRTPETEALVGEIVDLIWCCADVVCEIRACEFAIDNGGDIDGRGSLVERVADIVDDLQASKECGW